MSRLFIRERELNFISDITKECIKDVIGQKIYYYAISELKTNTHEVYNEAIKKVFDNPISIDCLVDSLFQTSTKINAFGVDNQYKIEVYIQYRDLVEKGINVGVGDFFSFSNIFYEITDNSIMRNIYGQAEHKDGVRIVGTKARAGQIDALCIGPTDISHAGIDADAVQKQFVQQRGFSENIEGKTGDVRELVKNGTLDTPISTPREISPRGDPSGKGSSFYDE